MKKVILIMGWLLMTMTSSFAQVPAACYDAFPAGCGFYENCLEQKQSCGNSGYAIGFGKKNCELISNIGAGQLSPAGLLWREATRKCLQIHLFPILQADWPMTCSGIKDFAFDTHSTCYTQPGNSFCKLPVGDWVTVFTLFQSSELDPATLEQLVKLGLDCLSPLYPQGGIAGIPDYIQKVLFMNGLQ